MENSEDFPNSENQMNSQFSQNLVPSNSPQFRTTTQNNQPSQFQNAEPSNKSKKKDAQAWTDEQDIALMYAWCFVSENAITGKNQKEDHLWRCISEMYEQARVENPHKMGEQRSKESLRSRYKRLNTNATKWMGVFKKAHERATSGQSHMDIVDDAHKLYGKGGFPDINVYQKVMRHVPKWKVELHDRTRPRPDDNDFEEGHGSSKKSRTDEEGGNPMEATQASDASTINRPLGREKAKSLRKGKGSTSQASAISEDFTNELRQMRLTREKEVETMTQLGTMRMKSATLNTLLGKNNLSPAEEVLKNRLLTELFP